MKSDLVMDPIDFERIRKSRECNVEILSNSPFSTKIEEEYKLNVWNSVEILIELN